MTKREADKRKVKVGADASLVLFVYPGWITLPNVQLRRADVREHEGGGPLAWDKLMMRKWFACKGM